jgi:hypothetical protein
MARPFPPWRLRGGPDALPVDQYSERYAMIFPPTEYPVAQHRGARRGSTLSVGTIAIAFGVTGLPHTAA